MKIGKVEKLVPNLKGAFLNLIQFLKTETCFKMMKNAFHHKRYLVFCSDFFGHVGRQLDKKF